MTAPVDIYPLSTAEGTAIPLEVVSPTGYMFIRFSKTPTNVIALPASSDMIILNSDEDCILRFSNNLATLPEEAKVVPDTLFLRKSMQVVVYPQQKFLSVRRLVLDGTLHLQFIDTWHGLALASQYERG